MPEFVRFRVNDGARFDALRNLFLEVKKDKDAARFHAPEKWVELVPLEVRSAFDWPYADARQAWLAARPTTPISIGDTASNLGARWNFYAVFEAFEDGEYELVDCVRTGPDVAEMRINALAYPYGGVGCMIALAEAFGFTVLAVDDGTGYEEFGR